MKDTSELDWKNDERNQREMVNDTLTVQDIMDVFENDSEDDAEENKEDEFNILVDMFGDDAGRHFLSVLENSANDDEGKILL